MKAKQRKKFIINVVYFTLIGVMIYVAVKYALGYFVPFIIGFIIALILKPAINAISKKTRIHEKAVAVILIVFTYCIIGFLFTWIGLKIIVALREGFINLPHMYAENIEPAIAGLFDNAEELIARLDPVMVKAIEDMSTSLSQSAGTVVSEISTRVIGFASSALSSLPNLFISILFAIISTMYFAMDFSKIGEYIRKLFPDRTQVLLTEVKSFATGIGFTYIRSYSLLMLLTFTELAIGLSILRRENSILIAVFIATVDILPVLGTGSVLLPWAFIELVKGNIPFAVGMTVLYIVITVVRNILEPRLVGQQIGLHPLVMLMCMYVGVRLFGFIGLFLLPVIVVMMKYFYENGKLHFGSSDI